MGFTPPAGRTDPERQSLFGGWGSGKTKAWLDIATAYQENDQDGTFYVIDTDNTAERFIQPGGSYEHLENVEVFPVFEWEEYKAATRSILPRAQRGDWIIVDMVDTAWEEVRADWIEHVYGQDVETYFKATRQMILESEAAGRKGHERQFGGSSGPDWDYITKAYLRWERPITLQSPAHTLLCSAVTEIRESDTEAIKLYGGTVRPSGQKRLGHRVHTIIQMSKRRHHWEAEVLKDRDRDEAWEGKGGLIEVDNFAYDYLVGIAGWETSGSRRVGGEGDAEGSARASSPPTRRRRKPKEESRSTPTRRRRR